MGELTVVHPSSQKIPLGRLGKARLLGSPQDGQREKILACNQLIQASSLHLRPIRRNGNQEVLLCLVLHGCRRETVIGNDHCTRGPTSGDKNTHWHAAQTGWPATFEVQPIFPRVLVQTVGPFQSRRDSMS